MVGIDKESIISLNSVKTLIDEKNKYKHVRKEI